MIKIKTTILNVPVLGKTCLRIMQIIKSPNEIQTIKKQFVSLDEELLFIKDQINELEKQSILYGKSSIKLEKRNDTILDRLNNLQNTRTSATLQKSNLETNAVNRSRFVDNHALDRFYLNFEKEFRGSEDLIINRLGYYLDRFKELSIDFKKHPVLDIGCGRGEMLTLLKSNDIDAIGVDLNKDMVKRAQDKELQVVQYDALDYLKKQKSGSLSAITGFHIIEHISFESIMELFQEGLRVLKKGGFLLLETPNPENIEVATLNFYLDPSHLNPLPPALIEFAAKSQGFDRVIIDRLHYQKMEDTTLDREKNGDARIIHRFSAAQDYAVIAYK